MPTNAAPCAVVRAAVVLRALAAGASAGMLAAGMLAAGVLAGGVAGGSRPGPALPAGAAPHQATAAPALVLTWTARAHVPNTTFVTLSSPNVATLTDGPAVVFGDRSGHVYAYSLATGAVVPGWPRAVGAPVTSTPAVVATPGTPRDTVLVGTGDAADPCAGGYVWLYPNGTEGGVTARNPSPDPSCAGSNGVAASMAVGTLQGQTGTVAGSLGQETYAMSATTRSVLGGFPWFQGDSEFGTPALADVERTGGDQIVESGASTAGTAYGHRYADGGHIRVLRATGNAGTANPAGGLVCEYTTDQTVTTSPAVGDVLGATQVGVVASTGDTYPGASQTDQVIAVTPGCSEAWDTTLTGSTATQSPAIADVLGNGQLQVVETTGAGDVYALDGADGRAVWQTALPRPVLGSPVTADLGTGRQDVLVASVNGLYVLTGTSGAVLESVKTTTGFQNAPLVTDDPNGTVGITVAGYQNTAGDVVYHFEIPGSDGAAVDQVGTWPQFHHDPQLTGSAGTPSPAPCSPPAPAHRAGYALGAAGGAVFTYGDAPYCGSAGNKSLSAPIVGIAATPTGGGYWLAGADGGIFTFGSAGFYGSMGGKPLDAPIVGIAAAPTGKGYWEVASDGGIFTFGDAGFYGSMGGKPLSAPIVGIAAA